MRNKRKSYASDVSDEEWMYLEQLIPAVQEGGRPAVHDRREIVNGIFYIVRSGCSWRMLPNDLPCWKTCYHYFRLWSSNGLWEQLHNQIRDWARQYRGKKKPPPLELSTRKVLKRRINPEFVATMLQRKSLEGKDIY